MGRITKSAIFALFLLSTLFIVACAGPDPEVKSTLDTDSLSLDIQKRFPVTLQKIGNGVWVHTSQYSFPGSAPIPSNGLIVQDGENLTLVDTAWGELATLSLLEVIKTEIGKPVTKLVLTHHHHDRLAGVDLLEAYGAKVYTHPDTAARAAQAGGPVPNTSVAALKEPKSRTKIGGVEIAYPGPAHAEENLIVYVPAEKILFGGCAVKGAGSLTLGNLEDAKVKDWPQSLNWIKQTYPDTKLVVPGHGKGAGLSLLNETLALLAKAVNTPE